MTMQRLSGTDAGFLAAETSTWPMHLGVVAVFDPSTAPPGLGLGQLGRLIELRLALLGLFRHRVVEVPGRIDRPVWVDVPDLDVGDHLRHAVLAAPGGPHELGDLVGTMFSEALDRAHPLWRLWHVDGLRDGNEALVFKIHHAATDGARGAQLYDVIFDLEADAPLERPDLDVARVRSGPSTIDLLGRRSSRWRRRPSASRAPCPTSRARCRGCARFAVSPERADAVLPFTAPRGPFNGTLTSAARLRLLLGPARGRAAVKQAFGVTVNDVVLAMCAARCAGTCRLATRSRTARSWRRCRWRSTGEDARRGRRDAGQLPLRDGRGAARPPRRSRRSAACRARLDPGGKAPAGCARRRPALRSRRRCAAGGDLRARRHVHDAPPRQLHPPIFNAIVSNVPARRCRVYSCGARLLAAYPLGPLLVGSGLNITVLSYADSLDVGITVCPDIVDDPWSIADAFPARSTSPRSGRARLTRRCVSSHSAVPSA